MLAAIQLISSSEMALFRDLCVSPPEADGSTESVVRHTQGMPPRDSLISLTSRKIAHFRTGNKKLQKTIVLETINSVHYDGHHPEREGFFH
jgi:hypothetical protein